MRTCSKTVYQNSLKISEMVNLNSFCDSDYNWNNTCILNRDIHFYISFLRILATMHDKKNIYILCFYAIVVRIIRVRLVINQKKISEQLNQHLLSNISWRFEKCAKTPNCENRKNA